MKNPIFNIAAALAFCATTSAMAGALPECDGSDVLTSVNRTLSIAEANVVQSGDPVVSISGVRQSKLSDSGPRLFAQRYCHATGYTATGRKQTIYYMIEANAGFAGYGYGVEACIPGRDPWKVHGAYCRSVR